ncbi:hypothetical protein MPLSOD_50171 [Mesorhizobium sp. SOD10]|nr:hypothetical protein MPLSOD_50171 [Mesorhizobium sp. SOD10]
MNVNGSAILKSERLRLEQSPKTVVRPYSIEQRSLGHEHADASRIIGNRCDVVRLSGRRRR